MTKTYLSQSIFTICVFVLGALLNGNAQVPTIISFTPLSTKPGDVITITGTNFNTATTNNVVFFGATKATVTAATATSLTVTVPVGATYAPITVLNTGTTLACASLSKFNPVYNPPKTTIGVNDYAGKQDFAADSLSFYTVMADFDNDGKPDLAVSNNLAATVSILRNTSNASIVSFAPKIDFTTVENPGVLTVGDVDADGKPDLVISNVLDTNYTVSILRNTSNVGSISFAAKVDVIVAVYPYGVAIGDIDGDGKPDITVCSHVFNSISTILNTSSVGVISFAGPVSFAAGNIPVSICINDLDGDGKLDVVISNSHSNSNIVSILRNESSIGTVNFSSQIDYLAGNTATTAAVGDLDGDGKPDIVTANYGSSSVSVFQNISTPGIINFAAKADFITNNYPYSVSIADITGDGKPDLAVASELNNTVSLLRNTSNIGAFSFATKVDFATGLSPTSIAIGDLDGDSIPEIVTANFGQKSVSVLRAASVILPLKWISINGTINVQNQAVIHWQVNETNVVKYEIEKSIDGFTFNKVGTINSNGNGTNNYEHKDMNILGGVAYYRIKQLDIDGRFSYSTIIRLSTSSLVNASVYPNPFNNYLIINSSKKQTITIVDVLGRASKKIDVKSGVNYITTADLHDGIYFLKTNDVQVIKIAKE
jgi:hypothetical protein